MFDWGCHDVLFSVDIRWSFILHHALFCQASIGLTSNRGLTLYTSKQVTKLWFAKRCSRSINNVQPRLLPGEAQFVRSNVHHRSIFLVHSMDSQCQFLGKIRPTQPPLDNNPSSWPGFSNIGDSERRHVKGINDKLVNNGNDESHAKVSVPIL